MRDAAARGKAAVSSAHPGRISSLTTSHPTVKKQIIRICKLKIGFHYHMYFFEAGDMSLDICVRVPISSFDLRDRHRVAFLGDKIIYAQSPKTTRTF